jgi:hypothetical protein
MIIQTKYAIGNTVYHLNGCFTFTKREKGKRNDSKKWFIQGPYTIGKILVSIGKNKNEEYMCNETGIGSGVIYKSENLFLTRQAAENIKKEREKINYFRSPIESRKNKIFRSQLPYVYDAK